MKFEIPLTEICSLITRQLDNFFILSVDEKILINNLINGKEKGGVMQKLEYNFSHNANKYYNLNGETYFNPYHAGQYTIFLYLMSRETFKKGNSILADKIYYLNRMMNGCDLFYEVELPDFFTIDHPLGTVIGRAKIGNGLSFLQCCTIGNNRGTYPIIGENCYMCAGSAIIGNCHIGNNVIIGAHACVKDQDVPDNCMVFGESPRLVIKHTKNE